MAQGATPECTMRRPPGTDSRLSFEQPVSTDLSGNPVQPGGSGDGVRRRDVKGAGQAKGAAKAAYPAWCIPPSERTVESSAGWS